MDSKVHESCSRIWIFGQVNMFKTQIKEQHLDTFGHVNNATYLQLFEEARWDYITNRGYGLKEILASKKGPVVLEAQIRFLKELRLRENIEITFEPDSMEGKVGKCRQRILNSSGEVACEAVFVVGFFDLNERKLIPPSAEWLHAVQVE